MGEVSHVDVKYYKVVDADGCSTRGGNFQWDLPTKNSDGTWTPGAWAPSVDGIEPRRRGYHVCKGATHLIHWLGPRIFECEIAPNGIEQGDKVVASSVRLIAEVATWTERTARLFSADCAERVLHVFEKHFPNDKRPRLAIQAARDFAHGRISRADLTAARAAAWDAAWDAARGAARDAAWDAARDAARDAELRWQVQRLKEYLEGKHG